MNKLTTKNKIGWGLAALLAVVFFGAPFYFDDGSTTASVIKDFVVFFGVVGSFGCLVTHIVILIEDN